MKRDPRLHGLTTDHHHALRLAFDVKTACASGRAAPDLAARVAAAYDAELGPHFAVEEDVLLPALAAAGEQALVDRTHAEHAALRALVAAAGRGETAGLAEFARLLHDHVRFEENELFPACEAALPAEVLEEAWRRAPKARGEVVRRHAQGSRGAASGCRHRNPGNRAKSLSVVSSSHPCSMARAAT